MRLLHDRGYLIVAINTADTDYVACARTLAKSLKLWHPDSKVCLLTDRSIDDRCFDIVRQIPDGVDKGWANDRWCFALSPFHETIKLESDMLISGPIDHWWTALRNRDMVISVGCRDHRGQTSDCRDYRRVFDDNNLLDTYNALTYWRYSKLSQDFFKTVGRLFDEWNAVKSSLRRGMDQPANTDLIYALAADLLGRDLFYIPGLDFFRITHLKPKILGLPSGPWTHWMTWEMVDGVLRIDGHAQSSIVHYQHKPLARDLENYYDRRSDTSFAT